MDRKEILTRIFFDTETMYKSQERLRRAVRATLSDSRYYPEGKVPNLTPLEEPKACQISVTRERTLTCAVRLVNENPGARVGVLNFASATRPGGGVRSGSSAQEEGLCRISTLYADLSQPKYKESFYDFHRERKDPLYTDSCIFSPGVMVIKDDSSQPERLPESEWRKVDVVTMAAPNLKYMMQNKIPLPSEEELYAIHLFRARKILSVAAKYGCTHFVTGAHGCGAFQNPPEVVARAWKEALSSLGGYFDQVVFAIYTTKNERNLKAFEAVFGQETEV